MLLAGAWLTAYLRQSDTRSAALMAAGYFQLILRGNPEGTPTGAIPAQDLAGLDLPPGRIEAVVFWRPDGTILSSTDPAQAGQVHDNPNLSRVLREGILSEIVTRRSDRDGGPSRPLLEIYVPLDPAADGTPRLVGEFYLDARDLLAAEARRALRIWVGVALTGGIILSLLIYTLIRARRVVVTQQVELDARIGQTERLLTINRALRSEADSAREDLIHGNEAVLNALAADLHDGPLQVLATAALSLSEPADPQGRHSTGALLAQAAAELRDLSSGLVLPELAGLDTRRTILLAVARHEGMTGAAVACQMSPALPDLDTAAQICLFRAIQEGLVNAFKHGGDQRPGLVVRPRRTGLVIAICSAAKDGGVRVAPHRVGGLGLRGLRRRLTALGGSMRHRRQPPDRMVMLVRLPLA